VVRRLRELGIRVALLSGDNAAAVAAAAAQAGIHVRPVSNLSMYLTRVFFNVRPLHLWGKYAPCLE
jgi:hypothetical protein